MSINSWRKKYNIPGRFQTAGNRIVKNNPETAFLGGIPEYHLFSKRQIDTLFPVIEIIMDLITQIQQKGLLIDGAMGTLLMQAGVQSDRDFLLVAIERPELLTKFHQAYLTAGADVMTTHTFRTNDLKLKNAGLEQKLDEINRAAVRIAREVAGNNALVAGDLGPTGAMLKPYGELEPAEAAAIFAEQAEVLTDAGADLLLVETMFDLNEALTAIRGIRQVSTLPIFASLTFNATKGGFATIMGNRVDSLVQLQEAGANAVGANCSIGSDQMVALAAAIRQAVGGLVIIQPNAGLPVTRNGETVYPESVTTFALNLKRIRDAGVEIIGGCCGTTPDYIRQIRRLIGD